MESNTLMEIERWTVTRGLGSRAGKGIDAAHAASRPTPPMRSAPTQMDVFHSPYCAASASWEVPRTDASTRHAPAPAFLATRAVGGVPPALPWVDAAAPRRGGRQGCPVSRSGEWRADARRRGFARGAVGGQRRGSKTRWPAVASGSPALVSGERR